MKLFKKLFEKKADERQQRELYKVIYVNYWIMYWLLFASFIYQVFILDAPKEQFMPEWGIFMISSICTVVGCIWKGVWSFQTKEVPSVTHCFFYSLAGAIGLGMPMGILIGIGNKYVDSMQERLLICGVSAVCNAALIFVLCFVAFCTARLISKARVEALEKKAIEEEEEDDE